MAWPIWLSVALLARPLRPAPKTGESADSGQTCAHERMVPFSRTAFPAWSAVLHRDFWDAYGAKTSKTEFGDDQKACQDWNKTLERGEGISAVIESLFAFFEGAREVLIREVPLIAQYWGGSHR